MTNMKICYANMLLEIYVFTLPVQLDNYMCRFSGGTK